MQQTPYKAEPKDRAGEYDTGEAFSERHPALSDIQELDDSFLTGGFQTSHQQDDEFGGLFDLELLQELEGTALRQPNIDPSLGATPWDTLPSSMAQSRIPARQSNVSSVDAIGYTGNHGMGPSATGTASLPSEVSQMQQWQSSFPHRRTSSLTAPPSESTRLLPQPSSRHSSAPAQASTERRYDPFIGLFNTSGEAKQYRRNVMRFGRQPYCEGDESVRAIAANRQVHVERIYNAMIRSDVARDNSGSVAMKRWVREPHYPSELVEAFAHKVFDCLLEQATEGFRGWQHNDYVIDERKGDEEDRNVNCAGRLDNIIAALEQEKTICEDVMASACQIRMFVNAPKAYANRKFQNRQGNSKRPGVISKDSSNPNPMAPKRRRGSKRGNTYSSNMSDVSTNTNRALDLLQSPESTVSPYYLSPGSERDIMSSSPPSFQPIMTTAFQSSSLPPQPTFTPMRQGGMNTRFSHMTSANVFRRRLGQGGHSRVTSMPVALTSAFPPPVPALHPGSAPTSLNDLNLVPSTGPMNLWEGMSENSTGSLTGGMQQANLNDGLPNMDLDWPMNDQIFSFDENLCNINWNDPILGQNISAAGPSTGATTSGGMNAAGGGSSQAGSSQAPTTDPSFPFQDFVFE